jgi:hypothetical protein
MAPVRPFDSTRDMLISAVFGRDKVGQTVKDLVIGVERFFTGKKVETVGGAARKQPPPPAPPRAVWDPDHKDQGSKSATKTAVAGVDVDSMPAIAGMTSFAMNHVASDVVGDRVQGALHTEARATASSQPATSAPVSADDSWSFSMFAKQGTQPQQPTTDDASQEQIAIAPDSEDASVNDDAQQPETDDEDASPEEVAMASDSEDAPSDDDAAQQPETEDDEEASQLEVALASDDEDARSDDDASQQPATDDDEDAPAQQVATASDSEDAPTDDAVMETASAQAATDPDDGFSFSAFPKPVTLADVVKEVMPAGQVSHEDMPGSGTPESESAHPDVASEDVGNAAPSKEPVVHHSDLAP